MISSSFSRFFGFSYNVTTEIVPPVYSFRSVDPYASSVSLLLNMDGENGSTAFTDSSLNLKTISRYGSAAISTANPKFGTGAVYFQSGRGDQLYTNTSNDLILDGDYTIEFWINLVSYPSSGGYPLGWNGGKYLSISNNGRVQATSLGTIGTTSALQLGQWHHIAVTRESGLGRIFFDGNLEASYQGMGNFGQADSSRLYINGYTAFQGTDLTWYIDDLRITKGVARYSTNFTPPTTSFSISSQQISEGESYTFIVDAENILPNAQVVLYWTVATDGNITNQDFVATSGSFELLGNTGSFSVQTVPDFSTEGTETFTVNLRTDSITGPVVATSSSVTILDTSIEFYEFTTSAASVNEGGTFTVTFDTTATGSLPYTITGVSSEDIDGAPLTGFVSNNEVLAFNVTADASAEGTETFTITLDNGQASATVTINDTSVPTYNLIKSSDSVNEGDSFTITFVTNKSGLFPYTITGVTSADIDGASLSGSVSNGQTLTFNVTADSTTEGVETFILSLDNGQASSSIIINDSSKDQINRSGIPINLADQLQINQSPITFVLNSEYIPVVL